MPNADNPEDVEVVIWRDGHGKWRCNIRIDYDQRAHLVETGWLELSAETGALVRVVALDPLPRDTITITSTRVSMPVDDEWVIDNA